MAHKSEPTAKSETSAAPKADPRAAIVDALLRLVAEQRFEDITITDICAEAKVSLADFRDLFPSKGAVLGGFSRRIDRAVLQHRAEDNLDEAAKERLFDVLMRRLEAMAPYRDALREVTQYLRRDPMAALAFNQALVNSMRFMLEAAGIAHEGPAGAIKLQGLVFAWAHIVDVWLADEEPGLAKTMAELDRVLTRGEKSVGALEWLDDFAAPFKALTRAVFETRRRAAENFRRRPRSAGHESEPGAERF